MVEVPDKYQFPTCMHALAAAFHIEGINPGGVVIVLKYDDWWRLYQALERKMRGFMRFDGRGSSPIEFQYMGFIFRIEGVK